ncbi:MAG: chondroitinase family polysaccharide lyase [Bacteroidales bacterium]
MRQFRSIFFILIGLVISLASLEAQNYEFHKKINQASPNGASGFINEEVWITSTNDGSVIKYDKGGNILATLTEGISKPVDVAVSASGDIYVADQGLKAILHFNPELKLTEKITLSSAPFGVSVSPDNELYIALGSEAVIYKDGKETGKIKAYSQDKIRSIRKVTFNKQGTMFIVDYDTGLLRISHITNETAHIDLMIKKENGANVYNKLTGVDFANDGTIFLTSDANHSSSGSLMGIYVFDANGIFLYNVGEKGTGTSDSHFKTPKTVSVLSEELLFVSDFNNNAVKIFEYKDTQAPSLTELSIREISRSNVIYTISADEACSFYAYIIAENAAIPSLEEIRSKGQKVAIDTKNQLVTISSETMRNATQKIAYFAEDRFANHTEVFVSEVFTTDSELRISKQQLKDKGNNQLSFNISANDAGQFYWALYTYNGTIPELTPADLLNPVNAVKNGSFVYSQANQNALLSIDGLEKARKYILYTAISDGSSLSQLSYCVAMTWDDVATIYKRYKELLTGYNGFDYSIPENQMRYTSLRANISKAHQLKGSYVITDNMPQYYLGIDCKNNPGNRADIDHLKDLIGNVLLPLSVSYHLEGPAEQPNADFHNPLVLNDIANLYKYMEARGFKYGCNLPNCGGGIYLRLTGLFYSSMLMKDQLQEMGVADYTIELLDWATQWVNSNDPEYSAETEVSGGRADAIRTMFNNRLMFALTLPDSDSRREELVDYMKQVFDSHMRISPAWDGMMKADFSAYHHRGIFGNAYVTEALHVASQIAMLLNNTQYALTPATITNIREGLLAYRSFCQKYDIPRGISGRFPNKLISLAANIPAYAFLYEVLSGEEKDLFGRIVTDLYDADNSIVQSQLIRSTVSSISFFGGIGVTDLLYKISQKGYTPDEYTNINRTYPYSALQVHRKNGWMAAVKGYSKYVWDFETDGGENWYGYNQSSGELSIYSGADESGLINAESSGTGYNGWDWSHVPGTTTLALSLEDIRKKVESFQWAKMSPEFYTGGVSHLGENGMFAMKYNDIRQNQTMKANKSYFFFGDKLIMLGSDIVNNHDTCSSAHTTLFQNLIANGKPVYVNGKAVNALGTTMELGNNDKATLVDIADNAYYIPGKSKVHFHYKEQSSYNDRNHSVTKGNYATAWIEHDKSSSDNYEYAVMINGGVSGAEYLSSDPGSVYTVIRKDATAHIVHSNELNMTGYAIFDNQTFSGDPLLAEISEPVMAMVSPLNENQLQLSLSNPELGFYPKDKFPYQVWSIDKDKLNAKSEIQPVTVTLNGKWSLKSNPKVEFVNYSVTDHQTTLRFNGKDAETVKADLINEDATSLENLKTQNFRVYPNPARDFIAVFYESDSDTSVSLNIYNMVGQVVLNQKIDANIKQTISVGSLPKGSYVIRLENRSASQKLIIQ